MAEFTSITKLFPSFESFISVTVPDNIDGDKLPEGVITVRIFELALKVYRTLF